MPESHVTILHELIERLIVLIDIYNAELIEEDDFRRELLDIFLLLIMIWYS
jgi:hypothetical protein